MQLIDERNGTDGLANGSETTTATIASRRDHLLARVRDRQLRLAVAGQVIASARYARLAGQLRAWRGQDVLAAAAVFAAAVLIGAPALAQQGPTVVRTAEVRRELVQQHQRVTGTLRAVSRAAVAAQEEGAVLRVLVDEGDAVKQGQAIAELDARRLAAQLAESEAELTAARAQVAEREAELARYRRDADKLAELRQTQVATQREYDDAVTAMNVGEAQLDSARRRVEQVTQRVALLKIRLADTHIFAPFDGRVVVRHVEPGVWVRPGDAVATIVSAGRIEARLEVPERLVDAVNRHAHQLSIAVEADGVTRASLAIRPVPQVDPRVRTFAVIAELDNSDEAMTPGMSVSAWVPAGESAMRTTVPKNAVIRSALGAMVYMASGKQPVAQPVPVKILFETGDRVVVESEQLADRDLVVVEGNERLMPSSPLVLAAQH